MTNGAGEPEGDGGVAGGGDTAVGGPGAAVDGPGAAVDGPGAGAGALAFEARDLAKSFGRLDVLSRVDLALPGGHTTALFGRNGAGKTTLLRIAATLLRPTRGAIRVLGKSPERDAEFIRSRLGFLSHQTYLYDDLTAEENLLYYARLYGVTEARDRVRDLLSRVGMTAWTGFRVRGFSRGMQQRLGLARALIHEPEMLLFDEPFTGLDTQAVDVVTRCLHESRAAGRTCILTTHSLERAMECADWLAVLEQGAIVHFGPMPSTLDALGRLYSDCLGGRAA